ncbi:derlin-1 [Cavenderia fasciculata]|uniref:Derlin n=1 Tax=Cavenderia fasciculata TaxID=261658 RepID=F4QEH3_CACFS|nr:derlin-1 [Cavenderia fasciculata]EGG13286.1 derlin-1 [Cavenderia fasciculata]|eukprot:XP_004349985.1 derlin-1 [Cavenderia fasciculata]
MDEVKRWWGDVPPITKLVWGSSVGFTLLVNFGLISGSYVAWDFELVYKKFQIYRLITPFLYNYLSTLERGFFMGRAADLLYMFLASFVVFLVAATFIRELSVLSYALLMLVIYVWSRMNPTAEVSFMFGLKFKAVFLPWVLLIFDTLTGHSFVPGITGITIGHIYYYLTAIYPVAYNKPNYLATPYWVNKLLPQHLRQRPGPAGGRAPAWGDRAQQPGDAPGEYHWGRGRALG